VGIEIVLVAIDFKRVSVTAMVEDFRDTTGVEQDNRESFGYQQGGGGRITSESHQRVLILDKKAETNEDDKLEEGYSKRETDRDMITKRRSKS
jgi:hypothetical protein